LWRNAGALFETARGEGSSFERPRAIDLVADSRAIEILGRDVVYDIEVMGVAAEKSRIDAARFERVQALAPCFNDPDAGTAVRESLDLCEKLVDGLNRSLFAYAKSALAPGGRDADSGGVRDLVKSFGALPAAWSALGVVFEGFIRTLGDDPHAALAGFHERAESAIRDVYRSATARPDTSGRWLKARALSERAFYGSLADLRPAPVSEAGQETSSHD